MLSEKVYRRLLVVYPKEYRQEYGELMVQMFRDRMRRDGGGFRGLLVWVQMTFDLVVAAFKEHKEHKEGKEGDKMKKRIVIALVAVLLTGAVGASALLASSEGGPIVSVVWHEADGGTVEEPEVSVVWHEADGAATEEPEVSVVWHKADGGTVEEPIVSVVWHEADGGATE